MSPSPRFPTDAELRGQKVGEDPLVKLGERRRRLEDGLGVKRPPLAVGDRSGPVPNHQMVVQLAIVSPAREVGEGRRDDTGDVF